MVGRTAGTEEPWWKASWSAAWFSVAVAAAGLIVAFIGLRSAPGDRSESTTAPPAPTITPPAPTTAVVSEPEYVFMYGTMKPGHRFYPTIDEFVAETEPASVRGDLYDTGAGYPAAVFDETGLTEISGFLIRWVPDQRATANATIADVENNLFRPVRVMTTDGIAAVAYEYVGDTGTLTQVDSGAWTLELEAKQN